MADNVMICHGMARAMAMAMPIQQTGKVESNQLLIWSWILFTANLPNMAMQRQTDNVNCY